eukprot:365542-Chlamydomonas_euryale.AAC.49
MPHERRVVLVAAAPTGRDRGRAQQLSTYFCRDPHVERAALGPRYKSSRARSRHFTVAAAVAFAVAPCVDAAAVVGQGVPSMLRPVVQAAPFRQRAVQPLLSDAENCVGLMNSNASNKNPQQDSAAWHHRGPCACAPRWGLRGCEADGPPKPACTFTPLDF